MKNTGTIVAIALIVVLALLLFGGAGMMGLGGFGMMGPGMMGGYGGMMDGYGYGFNPLGAILSLVSWGLVIGSVIWLVVWLARNVNGSISVSRGESAIGILKARYARGEITKEQFDAIKRDLET
jgi:putative membrane protein